MYPNSFHPKDPEDSKFPRYLGNPSYTNAVSQHPSYKSPPLLHKNIPRTATAENREVSQNLKEHLITVPTPKLLHMKSVVSQRSS